MPNLPEDRSLLQHWLLRFPLGIHLLPLSLEDFFIVADALMAFNSPICVFFDVEFEGQNIPNLSLFSQVSQVLMLRTYLEILYVP